MVSEKSGNGLSNFCCSSKPSTSILRVAVLQVVVFLGLALWYLFLGFDLDGGVVDNYFYSSEAFFITAGFHVCPAAFSFLLIIGVKNKNPEYIRLWILYSIIMTIALFTWQLGGTAYAVLNIEVLYGIPLCIIPVIQAVWMTQCILTISSYYNSKQLEEFVDIIV